MNVEETASLLGECKTPIRICFRVWSGLSRVLWPGLNPDSLSLTTKLNQPASTQHFHGMRTFQRSSLNRIFFVRWLFSLCRIFPDTHLGLNRDNTCHHFRSTWSGNLLQLSISGQTYPNLLISSSHPFFADRQRCLKWMKCQQNTWNSLAGRNRFFNHCTDWGKQGAQEKLEVWRTFWLHKHFKLLNFGVRFFLSRVFEQIGKDRHVILNIGTKIHSNWYTMIVVLPKLNFYLNTLIPLYPYTLWKTNLKIFNILTNLIITTDCIRS